MPFVGMEIGSSDSTVLGVIVSECCVKDSDLVLLVINTNIAVKIQKLVFKH
jgi:hypothetical protein